MNTQANQPTARGLASFVAMGLAAPTQASAQWSATNLHPPGAAESYVQAVHGRQQGGFIVTSGGLRRAVLWKGTAQSVVDLHIEGSTESVIMGMQDGEQVGHVKLGTYRASRWSGTPGSWVDLHPDSASMSYATGISNGQQVGHVWFGTSTHASIWSGTSASWIDLNPGNLPASRAYSGAAGLQVGSVDQGGDRAAIWSDTPESWVDVHPPLASSSVIFATDGRWHVGKISAPGGAKATLWFGTSNQPINLHPNWPGLAQSSAVAVHGPYQAGWVGDFQMKTVHAALWRGSGASAEDLHAVLPPGNWSRSEATGMWTDDTTIYVVGNAATPPSGPSPFGKTQAILWTRPIDNPCLADCDASGSLSIDDFVCFQTFFAVGDLYADCDQSGSLDIDDFVCFQTFFALGC